MATKDLACANLAIRLRRCFVRWTDFSVSMRRKPFRIWARFRSCTIAGTETIKINSPQGELRFKVPEWSITEWIDRPKVMDGGASAPEPAPAAVSQPPAAAEPTGANLF